MLLAGLIGPAVGQATWHGPGQRPALKATEPDGQAAELLRLSDNYLQQRQFDQALQAAEDALALLEKRYGPTDRRLAPALKAVGAVHFRQARHQQVEPHYARAVEILEKGGDPVAYADSLSALAKLHLNSAYPKRAVPLQRRALGLYEKAFGADPRRLQMYIVSAANTEKWAGNYGDAYRLLERAGTIAAQEGAVARASVDVDVADVMLHERRYEEAAVLQRKVIDVYSKHFGAQHQALVVPYAMLARALDGLGRKAEADEARARVRALRPAR